MTTDPCADVHQYGCPHRPRVMNDRDQLAALILTTEHEPRSSDYLESDEEWAMFHADAIIAAGWTPPPAEHEHNWVDVRDLVTGADFCSVCERFR